MSSKQRGEKMDNGSQDCIHIRRLPHGGYVVRDGNGAPDRFLEDWYATDDIEKALDFVRRKIVPIPPIHPMQNVGMGAALGANIGLSQANQFVR